MVFDLTETFGAGKEPNLASIKKYISGWFLEKNLGINREMLARISALEETDSVSKSINNLLIFGDSITETATINEDGTGYTDRTATNWPTYLSSSLEIGTMKNYARSGAAYEPPIALIDAVTKMAKRYNFIIIDALNESGIVRDFEVSGGAGRYLRDRLHPNESDKELLGKYYSNEIYNSSN